MAKSHSFAVTGPIWDELGRLFYTMCAAAAGIGIVVGQLMPAVLMTVLGFGSACVFFYLNTFDCIEDEFILIGDTRQEAKTNGSKEVKS